MKKIKCALLLGLAVLGISASQRAVKVSDAYNDKYLDPTIPAGYYDGIDTTKSPDDIKLDLYDIISSGYKQHSYSSNNEVLKNTDPDPNKSGNIICFYTGQSLNGGWNKEHVWAKSHGFPESGYKSSEPYSDAHHLRPTLNSINSSRGNLDFGEVTGGKTDGFGNEWNSSAFEPRDEVKGDVARIMFYMETRYGAKTKFNLKLVNDSTTSGSSLNGRFGNLQTLIKWNYEDPVSPQEIYRNNVIYTDYQKNRNPYIDHPEWVDVVYPSEYSTSTTVDQEKVDSVIASIAALPNTITLDNEVAVNLAKASYDALNYKEKQLVTNSSKLNDAIATIKDLKGEEEPDPTPTPKPDDPLSGDTVDFSGLASNSLNYTLNYKATIGNKSFNLSGAGSYDGEFRVGHNKSNASLSKFGLSTQGHYIEMNYDVEGTSGVEFNHGTEYQLDDWYIFFSTDQGSSYTKVAEGVGGTNPYKATLSQSQTGRYALVIVGNTSSRHPRVALNSITIATASTPVVPTPEKVEVGFKSGLSFYYDSTSFLEAVMRYNITLNEYDSNTTYAVFGFESDYFDEFNFMDFYDGQTSLDDLALDTDLEYFELNDYLVQNNNSYVLKDFIEFTDYYDASYTMIVVCEKDGVLSFSTEYTISFMDAYNELIASGALTSEQAALIKASVDAYFENEIK